MTSLKDFFKNESPAVLFMNFHVHIALTLKRSIRLLCLFFINIIGHHACGAYQGFTISRRKFDDVTR